MGTLKKSGLEEVGKFEDMKNSDFCVEKCCTEIVSALVEPENHCNTNLTKSQFQLRPLTFESNDFKANSSVHAVRKVLDKIMISLLEEEIPKNVTASNDKVTCVSNTAQLEKLKLLMTEKLNELSNRCKGILSYTYNLKSHFLVTGNFLSLCIIIGNLDVVKYLIDEGVFDCNEVDSLGCTPVHFASAVGPIESVKTLVARKADCCKVAGNRWTAFHFAAMYNQADILRYLIQENGSILTRENTIGLELLHTTICCKADLELVKFLVEEKKMDFVKPDVNGMTPLYLACINCELDVVKYLVGKGSDIHYLTKEGRSPLQRAVLSGRLEIVKYFVEEKKVDVNYVDKVYGTILCTAVRKGHLEATRYLVEKRKLSLNVKTRQDGRNIFHLAVVSGNFELVKYVYQEMGKDISEICLPDYNRVNPLHSAAEAGHLEIVKYLIKLGLSVNGVNNLNKSPLHLACFHGHFDVIKCLIEENGADTEAKDCHWKTPLQCAALGLPRLDIIKYLVEKCNADILYRDCCNRTALYFNCVTNCDLEVVKYLVEKGSDFQNITLQGRSPLSGAVFSGNFEVVKFFVEEKGADINIRDIHGKTLLANAVESGRFEIAKYFIESKGLSTDTKDNSGRTILHLAVHTGNLELVKFLMEKDGVKNYLHSRRSDSGRTPLCEAAQIGSLDVVKYLLQCGSNVDNADFAGLSALSTAARYGHLPVVKLLVGVGAKVHAISGIGRNALHWACLGGDLVANKYISEEDDYNRSSLEVVKYLIEEKHLNIALRDKVGFSALHLACKSNNCMSLIEIVKRLVERGASVDNVSLKDETPALLAASSGNFRVLMYLIENGANVHCKDKYGNTPLSKAVEHGHIEIAKYLIENHGLSTDIKFDHGRTILHLAACSGDFDFIKYLVEKGVTNCLNICRVDSGMTPLFEAVIKGSLEIVQLFVEKGANIHCVDCDGKTALHVAANYKHLHIVKYLLAAGADILALDYSGKSVLHWACIYTESRPGNKLAENDDTFHFWDVVKFLVEDKQADVMLRDKNNCTPVMLACGSSTNLSCLDLVKYLIKKGANIHDVSFKGKTCLHGVAHAGFLPLLKYLVEEKYADVNVKDKDGNSVLSTAVSNGHYKVAKYLIEVHGLSVHDLDGQKGALLCLAIEVNDCGMIKYLLNEEGFANCINSRRVTVDSNNTPLTVAVVKGSAEIVKLLLDKVNMVDCDGRNLLQLAVRNTHWNVVRCLIDAGANFNAVDRRGVSILHLACASGDFPTVKYLIEEKGADISVTDSNVWTPLYYAAATSCRLDIVKYLVEERGANIVNPDVDGVTALHVACLNNGSLDVIKYLVEKGSIVNNISSKGRTALQAAVAAGKLDIVKYLIDVKGADMHTIDENRHTILCPAVEKGHLDVAKYLIDEKGLPTDVKDLIDRTILHLAVHSGNFDLIRYLIDDKGIKNCLNARRTDSRWTPLFDAVSKGFLNIVQFLANRGANINAFDPYGNTPLHRACTTGDLPMVKLLVSLGARVKPLNKKGWSPLECAKRNSFSEIVRFLEEKMS